MILIEFYNQQFAQHSTIQHSTNIFLTACFQHARAQASKSRTRHSFWDNLGGKTIIKIILLVLLPVLNNKRRAEFN